MTRDEAVSYIQAHPAMFGDWPLEAILGRVQSNSDSEFYDPTTWVDPDAGNVKPAAHVPAPAPRPHAPAPIVHPSAPAAPPKVMKAGLLGVPGPVWITGILLAAGLAYHKQIEKAVR